MFVKNSIVCAYDDAQQRQNMNVTSAIKVSECLVFCTIPIQRLSACIHVAVFREIHSIYSLKMRGVCHPEVRGICWPCMNEASSLLNPYQCWKDSMRLLHHLPCNSEGDRRVPGSTLFLCSCIHRWHRLIRKRRPLCSRKRSHPEVGRYMPWRYTRGYPEWQVPFV